MALAETARREGMAAIARDWLPPMLAAVNPMANAAPNGRLEIVEGAGPMRPVEAPEALTRILVAFLTG